MRSKIATDFYNNVSKMPNKTAIVCGNKKMTFCEFGKYVSQCSNFLLHLGLRRGDRFAVLMDNCIESTALFISAADLGLCIVPLNPTLPVFPIDYAIKTCEIDCLIAPESFYNEIKGYCDFTAVKTRISFGKEIEGTISFKMVAKMSSERPLIDVDEDDNYILVMTSGSTGNPKPITLSQRIKNDRIRAHCEKYSLTSEDNLIISTPLYHSLAERIALISFTLGSMLIILPQFVSNDWVEAVENYSITFAISTPNQLAQIISNDNKQEKKFDSLRHIISSSSALDIELKKELMNVFGHRFSEIYGTSETSTLTSICFEKNYDKLASVGSPFFDADILILREDSEGDFDTECNYYEIGEMVCKSKLMCKGYYKQESLMMPLLKDGYFRTGDLGYKDTDGFLYFVGRKSEIIVSGAVNVYPNDIDIVVRQIPEVYECAAFGYPDKNGGDIVAIALVLNEGSSIDVDSIKLFCSNHLADFQQPQKIFILDRLPKNTMGKIQRSSIYKYIKRLKLDY